MDGRCFPCAVAVELNYQNLNDHPERVNNINLFIDQYDWKEIEFPSHKKARNKF